MSSFHVLKGGRRTREVRRLLRSLCQAPRAGCFGVALLLLLSLPQGAGAQGSFSVGDRVDVDIIMAGAPDRAMWRSGVITKIEGGEYFVRLDSGEERSLPIRPDKQWIRASQAAGPEAPPAPPGGDSGSGAGGGGKTLKAGDRVEVDIIMAGSPDRAMWRTGKIVKIEGGEYFVRLDNGEERSVPIRPDKHWVRASEAPPAPVAKSPVPAPAPGGSPEPSGKMPALPGFGSTTPGTGTTAGGSTSNPTTVAPAPPAESPGGNDELKAPGLGAPPNGIYNCEKIGQTYLGLGKLEIRGNTYRGIDEEGKGTFHPFTVDGSGQIQWSAGLTGLPEGWTIRSSYYAGPDSQGRALIRVYYRSSSGFNDLIDCVREKP